MELKQDPELVFLDEVIKFMADLNDKTRILLMEYDILKGLVVPDVQPDGQDGRGEDPK